MQLYNDEQDNKAKALTAALSAADERVILTFGLM